MTIHSITISVAWWLRIYLYALVICCHFTGLRPHDDRLAYRIGKGLSVESTGRRKGRNPYVVIGAVGCLLFAYVCVTLLLALR